MNPNYCNAGVVWPPKVPKDGWGPRGVPDCYYTSRVLNSTGHYVRFVKKLRITEEEDRIARLDLKKKNEDQQCIDFFQKCDRKNYITRIANRVDICFKAYEKELQERREKLKNMLCEEEKKNMWLFTKKAQSVSDVIWQGKMENLARLLAKRKKEVEARVSDPPLSKCAHVLPCIVKLRAKEAEEIQLYQIREKQLRKEAEREMDKMWYEVTMKESDALAARMDYMAIDRLRRDKECTEQTLKQIEMNKMKRANEQEMLKQQVLRMKADFEEGERKEREAQEKRRMNVLKQKEEITNDILKRKELMAEQQAKEKIISGTWESLAEQSLPGDRAKEEARRQKRRELDECNAKMVAMKNRIADIRYDNDPMILEEGRRLLDAYELKRCQHDAFMKKRFVDTQNVNKGVVEKDEQEALRKAEERRREEEYNQELTAQLNQLVRNKQLTDAQARKLHQKDLVKQSEYNKLLKDRARQEALEQDKKYKIARGQYQEQIEKMLSRPFFSDAINPFMKQMASEIRMRDMCPCGAPDYCLNPIHEKPKTQTDK